MRRLIAPGKLVLVGEYAVVDGAPAIVSAVNRGVCVDIHPAPRVELVTPGDDRFARAAIAGAPPARYEFYDHHPTPTRTKAGFGGSAAATVAGVAARHLMARGSVSIPDVFAESFAIHHQVQGSGSGIDIAASSFGGVLRFEASGVRPENSPPSLAVVWSGQSASTGPRVERYLGWRERSDFIRTSTAIVDAFSSQPIAMLDAAWELLCAMARASGIDYRTPAIDKAVALARERGGAAKPSGAGGGDCLVALFPDSDAHHSFCLAIARQGLSVIPVAIAPGVAEQPQEDPT